LKKLKKLKKIKIFFFIFQKILRSTRGRVTSSNIVIGNDARLQLGELVPDSPNTEMANFLSFDVYDIDLSKVMNDSNLNFVLLQTTNKSIIVVEDLDRFLMEKSMVVSLFIEISELMIAN
jgi:hypothetical protein